jgi:hypothetical protein
MQAAILDAPHAAEAARLDADRLRQVVLVRIVGSPKGCAKANVSEDLAPFVAHRLSPGQWRATLDADIAALILKGHVAAHGARLEATESGRTAAAEFLGVKQPLPSHWADVRDTRLVARALGLEKETAKRLKALGKPDGLRLAILQKGFTLKIKGVPTPSRVRAALAAVALDRAFGSRGRDGFGQKLGLSAKAGRKLAGQLARHPRDFGTDSRLIAALAAEQAGAVQVDMSALQQAVLRRFLDGDKAAPLPVAVKPPRPPKARKPRLKKADAAAPQAPSNAPELPLEAPAPAAPAAPDLAQRPDLEGFSKTIRLLAAKDAQGWAGNRKAYISHIWRRLAQEHAAWGLSEIEFKCMLAEAHRAGHVVLANADLKDASTLKDVQESAVVYKNAVFHFVRVEA